MLDLKAGSSQINALTFSPEGDILIAAGPGGLFIYRGMPTPVLSQRKGHRAIFIPGTQKVLIVDTPGTLWDLTTDTEKEVPFGPGYVPMGTATPDGRFVIFARIEDTGGPRRSVLFARSTKDLTNETPLWEVQLDRAVLGAPLITPDSSRCIVAEEDSYLEEDGDPNGLREYEVQTGQLLRSWEPSQPDFGRWLLSPDGRQLVVAEVGRLRVFALDSPEEEITVVKNRGWSSAPSISFHPSGKWVAAWHNGPTIKLFNTETWKPEVTLNWKIGKTQAVAFSENGLLGAAGGHRGKIVVWDFDT